MTKLKQERIVKVEVFGEGVDMWLKSQSDNKDHKQKDNIDREKEIVIDNLRIT